MATTSSPVALADWVDSPMSAILEQRIKLMFDGEREVFDEPALQVGLPDAM
jgi:hypothetical protein